MKLNYQKHPKTQASLPLFAWAARARHTPRLPAVRHVQRLGVRSPSIAALLAELAGLNVGADHD
jgi:hypothetical protein